ncbi:MAG: transglycosylase SLT domain-containing protein [Acidobacteria bacterium]|nr:transglycosylase SLT domain-containing protein [Acidobacteriota bacterium]
MANGALRWKLGLAVVLMAVGGCGSGGATPRPAQAQAAKPQPAAAAANEDMPPVLTQPWKGDLDGIVKRRVLRVLVPYRRPEFFYVEGRPAGVLQEAFQELETVLNTRFKTTSASRISVALLPTPAEKFKARMEGGYADIAAGSISVSAQFQKDFDFTVPTMTGVSIIAVTGPGAPELASKDDLSGKEVWVMPQTRMVHDVEALNAQLKSKGKPAVKVKLTDSLLEPGDVMEMVNAGIYPIALMQSAQADFWAKVFTGIKPRKNVTLAEDLDLGWAIQKNTPKLKAFLDGFMKTHAYGTAFGSTVVRRYLTDMKYVRNATEEFEMKRFRATLPHFQKYSKQYDLDVLLMAAQGYQESRLDQSVKSPVGAIGIMQVMPKTAAGAPVKIPNITTEANNIHAGAKLLHYLIEDHFNEPGLDRFNRMLFAIASYNAGPARIAQCRTLAKKLNLDPNKWFNNVEVAAGKIIGRETTQYVANIYKYYVCYRMALEIQKDREERKLNKSGAK